MVLTEDVPQKYRSNLGLDSMLTGLFPVFGEGQGLILKQVNISGLKNRRY